METAALCRPCLPRPATLCGVFERGDCRAGDRANSAQRTGGACAHQTRAIIQGGDLSQLGPIRSASAARPQQPRAQAQGSGSGAPTLDSTGPEDPRGRPCNPPKRGRAGGEAGVARRPTWDGAGRPTTTPGRQAPWRALPGCTPELTRLLTGSSPVAPGRGF